MPKRRGSVLAICVFVAVSAACSGLPRLSDYRQHALPLAQTSFLYASDGSLITELHALYPRLPIILLLGVMTVIGTFISDLLLMWVDPRIRLGRQ